MRKLVLVPVYLCLAAICLLFVFPFYWVVVSSLETISGLNLKPPALYPAVLLTTKAVLPLSNNIVQAGADFYAVLPTRNGPSQGQTVDPHSVWMLKLEQKVQGKGANQSSYLEPTRLVRTLASIQTSPIKLIPVSVPQKSIIFPKMAIESVNGQTKGIVADQIRGSGDHYQEVLLTINRVQEGKTATVTNISVLRNPQHVRLLKFHAEWSNYLKTLKGPEATIGGASDGFLLFMRNSLFLAFFAVFAQLASSSLVAYGFSRLQFKGRNFLFIVLLSTLMIPGQVTMIPLFFVFKALHWVNSFLPLMIPQLTAGAFNVFLIRQFLLTFPKDLDESATIDGASHWRIYRNIILPNLTPVFIVVGLFTFIATWQDVLGPLIYLDSPSLRTVTLGLEYFRSPYVDNRPLLLAGAVLSILPVFALFLVAQKHILSGIATTGLKE